MSDDEMIEHLDIEELVCLHQLTGHLDILGRWTWITWSRDKSAILRFP
jgi:hypothetical protein